MFLVPRQLRRSDFPSSVPYYGGRLTPRVIAGLKPPPPSSAPGTPLPPPAPPDHSHQLATLDELRAQGVLTEAEYDQIRQRVLGGS
jgi:Short C-terminal domain